METTEREEKKCRKYAKVDEIAKGGGEGEVAITLTPSADNILIGTRTHSPAVDLNSRAIRSRCPMYCKSKKNNENDHRRAFYLFIF